MPVTFKLTSYSESKDGRYIQVSYLTKYGSRTVHLKTVGFGRGEFRDVAGRLFSFPSEKEITLIND